MAERLPVGWLDRAIGWVSPRWAWGRIAWRAALRTYDAAGLDRLNEGWTAINQPGMLVDRASRDTIRARARDLERNSDIAESIILAHERNVVGTGFKLQAKIGRPDGSEDKDLNGAIEELWREWCRPRNCDIQGRLGFAEMCRMAVRRVRVDGGIFFIRAFTEGGLVPFCLQMKEVDELDSTMVSATGKLANGNYVVDGIEVDAVGRHIGYYFRTFTPDGFQSLSPSRVEAERVIYLQRIMRPSQAREMSPMAPSLSRIRDMNEYIESVSVQARVAACFAMVLKKQTPAMAGGLGRGAAGTKTDEASGYGGQSVTPGMIYALQPGEDVASVNPPNVGTSAKDLLSIQQRLAGSGQGLSYEAASRDMSQVNYSSARQGRLDDIDEYQEEQAYLVEHLLSEAYRTFVISAALAGKLPITPEQLFADRARYMRHEFIARGWAWIDPMKEATANRTALETGQTTLQRICAESGLDWREVIAQRALEIAAMKDAGIPIVAGSESAVEAALIGD